MKRHYYFKKFNKSKLLVKIHLSFFNKFEFCQF
jgi:hypothetical protein